MIARIRKLNNDDITALKEMDNDNAKILIEELQSNEEEYIGYGIFFDLDELVGFCCISNAEDFSNYKYYDQNSKAISELYILPEYSKIIALYCDLLDFVINDKENKEYNIYFVNDINLEEKYYDHLGFISIDDGILIRISENNRQLNSEESISE